jgi:rod shape-determining protein MreC
MKRFLYPVIFISLLFTFRPIIKGLILRLNSIPFHITRMISRSLEAKPHPQIEQLKIYEAKIKELEAENKRLKELLDFKTKEPNILLANVIGVIREELLEQFVINVGERVKRGSAVVTPEGLVGIIEEVGKRRSVVMTYADPRFNIAGRISSTRELCLVKNDGKRLLALYLDVDTDCKIGDVVVTAGGESVPKGIIIGEVEDIYVHDSQLYKIAVLRPYVNLRKVEEVFVLVHPG